MRRSSWKKMITREMKEHRESWADVEQSTLTKAELNTSFDAGHGGENGVPFTVWTKKRVYFPARCHGSEWVASVPRHPDRHKTEHIGA